MNTILLELFKTICKYCEYVFEVTSSLNSCERVSASCVRVSLSSDRRLCLLRSSLPFASCECLIFVKLIYKSEIHMPQKKYMILFLENVL